MNNHLGASGRGVSNSIYSPGVSGIFGGAPAGGYQSRPVTAPVQSQAAGVSSGGRYTNTFRSSAFTHAEYEPPVKNDASAFTRADARQTQLPRPVFDRPAGSATPGTTTYEYAQASNGRPAQPAQKPADHPDFVNRDLINYKNSQK